MFTAYSETVANNSGPPTDPPITGPPDEGEDDPPDPPDHTPPIGEEPTAPQTLRDFNIPGSAAFSSTLNQHTALNDYLRRLPRDDHRDNRNVGTGTGTRKYLASTEPVPGTSSASQGMGLVRSGDTAFGMMQYSRGGRDTRGEQTGYRYNAPGLLFGMVAPVEEVEGLRVGGVAGLQRTNAKFRGNRGQTEIDSFRLGTYAGWRFHDGGYVHGGVIGSAHRFRTDRGDDPVKNRHRGHDISGFVASGYDFPLTESWTLTPEASIQYVYLRERAYRDADDTSVRRRTEDILRAGSDLRLSYRRPAVAVLAYTGELLGGVAYDVSADRGEIRGHTANGDPFRVRGPSPRRVSGVFGGSLGIAFDEEWRVITSYRGLISSDAYDHMVAVELSRRF